MNKQQVAIIVCITVFCCWNLGIWMTYDENRKEDRSGFATGVAFAIFCFLCIILMADGYFDPVVGHG